MAASKLKTYAMYFWEYLKHGDFISIFASVKYLLRKGSHANDRIVTSSIGKFYCRKNTNDFQFANYRYEWGVKKYMLENIKNFDVFIDGGACVGEYCILLTKMGVKCIAFEPVEQNFNVLAKNIELNNMTDKIQAFSSGLGDHEMQAPFYFNPVNTGASHIILNQTLPDIVTRIQTFDSFLPKLGLKKENRIMFKLDVECMEPEAIRGASVFIKEYPNITFVAEDKHIGGDLIKSALRDIADFDFGVVDSYNMCATKRKNHS